MTMAKFRETSPNVDWATYLKDVDVTVSVAKVNVAEPAFFKRLDALITNTPLDDWKAYLRYHALSSSASWLSKPFVDENFKFNSHFSGAKELLPRWKRCARNDRRAHRRSARPGLRRQDVLAAGAGARDGGDRRHPRGVRRTREEARLDVRRDEEGGARQAREDAREGRLSRQMARLRRRSRRPTVRSSSTSSAPTRSSGSERRIAPVSPSTRRSGGSPCRRSTRTTTRRRTRWSFRRARSLRRRSTPTPTTPPTMGRSAVVGRGTSSRTASTTRDATTTRKEICAIGGRRPTRCKFTKEAQKVVDQFNGYIQIDTIHVNGKLTLGENIADLGGMLTGVRRAAARAPAKRPAEAVDRRLHAGAAILHRLRAELAHAQPARDDAHARRSSIRTHRSVGATNGPLSNFPAFAAAFGCKPGDPMVRSANVAPHLW